MPWLAPAPSKVGVKDEPNIRFRSSCIRRINWKGDVSKNREGLRNSSRENGDNPCCRFRVAGRFVLSRAIVFTPSRSICTHVALITTKILPPFSLLEKCENKIGRG